MNGPEASYPELGEISEERLQSQRNIRCFGVGLGLAPAGALVAWALADHMREKIDHRENVEANVPVCTTLAEGGDLAQLPTRKLFGATLSHRKGTILQKAQSLDEVVAGCSEEVQVYLTRECVAASIAKSYESELDFNRSLIVDTMKEKDVCVSRD